MLLNFSAPKRAETPEKPQNPSMKLVYKSQPGTMTLDILASRLFSHIGYSGMGYYVLGYYD